MAVGAVCIIFAVLWQAAQRPKRVASVRTSRGVHGTKQECVLQRGVNYSGTGWLHGQPGHSPAGRTLGAAGSVCASPSHISFFRGACDLHMHECCGGRYSWVWTVTAVRVGRGNRQHSALSCSTHQHWGGKIRVGKNLTPLLTSPADQ